MSLTYTIYIITHSEHGRPAHQSANPPVCNRGCSVPVGRQPSESDVLRRGNNSHPGGSMDEVTTVDKTGNFVGKDEGWIETFTGKAFPVLNPQPEDICIEDIAHALSNISRYNGHCSGFYSVAQHSCHVSDWLALAGYQAPVQLCGLLHDASEAYCGDVVRPLKPVLTQYATIERVVQEAICERFAILEMHDLFAAAIKSADNSVLRAEAEQLMRTRGKDWNFGETVAAKLEIARWSPEYAKVQFMLRFKNLYRENGHAAA